jgi:hypothetical protein
MIDMLKGHGIQVLRRAEHMRDVRCGGVVNRSSGLNTEDSDALCAAAQAHYDDALKIYGVPSRSSERLSS